MITTTTAARAALLAVAIPLAVALAGCFELAPTAAATSAPPDDPPIDAIQTGDTGEACAGR